MKRGRDIAAGAAGLPCRRRTAGLARIAGAPCIQAYRDGCLARLSHRDARQVSHVRQGRRQTLKIGLQVIVGSRVFTRNSAGI